MPKPKYKLFVYGTLKRGFCNHHYLKGSRFLSQATTAHPYPLVAPKKWYPYLIDKEGEGEYVEGELYMIDLATLKRIDRLEEYPLYYDRRVIEVIDSKKERHKALCYFLKPSIPYKRFPFLKRFETKKECS